MSESSKQQTAAGGSAELLPVVPGHIQGVVAVRQRADGSNEYDLQCQRCRAIETPKILVLMKFIFPECTIRDGDSSKRSRLCPDCHAATCDRVSQRCRELLAGEMFV